MAAAGLGVWWISGGTGAAVGRMGCVYMVDPKGGHVMVWRIELIPLALNVILTAYYVYDGREFGHMLYWGGAVVLTAGLMMMKG